MRQFGEVPFVDVRVESCTKGGSARLKKFLLGDRLETFNPWTDGFFFKFVGGKNKTSFHVENFNLK